MTLKKTAWIGLDVSKNTFDAAFLVDQTVDQIAHLPSKPFKSTDQGMNEFVDWVKQQCKAMDVPFENVRIMMESTGNYSKRLWAQLIKRAAHFAPAIVNAKNTHAFHQSLGLRNKTDACDARALAFYGRERQPKPYEPLSPTHQKVRELSRFRSGLIKRRTALTNQMSETADKEIKSIQRLQKRELQKHLKRIEKKLDDVIKSDDELKRQAELYESIPGVGKTIANTVIGEMGDLRRFNKREQVAAFVGLTPKVYQSGTSVKRRTTLSRQGNPVVRRTLYMGALSLIKQGGSTLSDFYQKRIDKGMAPKAAVIAVMRKMIIIMRALAKSGKKFRVVER